MTRIAVLAASIALASLITGCDFGKDSNDSNDSSSSSKAEETASSAKTTSAPAGVAEPRTVEDSGKFAAQAVEKVYGREVAPGQPTVIGAACTNGDCVVRYRSEARGEGKVLSEQDRALRPLFARDDVRSVKLYVHHWQTGTPDKNEAPVFAITTCRRSEHPSYDWAHIKAGDVTRVCKYTHEAGGRLRSQVRRGLKSNKQASQGQGGGSGQGGGP